MEKNTMSAMDFVRGNNKEDHYKKGRCVRNINRTDILGYCKCGYLTLKPEDAFEQHNGGLTVKRSNVKIIDNGKIIQKLRPRLDTEGWDDIQLWYGCNACVNGWK